MGFRIRLVGLGAGSQLSNEQPSVNEQNHGSASSESDKTQPIWVGHSFCWTKAVSRSCGNSPHSPSPPLLDLQQFGILAICAWNASCFPPAVATLALWQLTLLVVAGTPLPKFSVVRLTSMLGSQDTFGARSALRKLEEGMPQQLKG